MKVLNKDILLEYLVDGHEKSDHAESFFNYDSESEIYFLNNIVLHEVITALEENVKFDKSDSLRALRALLSNSQIRFENREIITEVLEIYSVSRDSFSECLQSVINAGYQMRYLASFKNRKAISKA